jgi:hypothetical protein
MGLSFKSKFLIPSILAMTSCADLGSLFKSSCTQEKAYSNGLLDGKNGLGRRLIPTNCALTKEYTTSHYGTDYEGGYVVGLDFFDKENCNHVKADQKGRMDASQTTTGQANLSETVCLNSKYYSHEKYKKDYVAAFHDEFCSFKNLRKEAIADAEKLNRKESYSFFKICTISDYREYEDTYKRTLESVCSPAKLSKLGMEVARSGKSSFDTLQKLSVCPSSSAIYSFSVSYESEKQIMMKEEALRRERERFEKEKREREERTRLENLRLEREKAERENLLRQENLRLVKEKVEKQRIEKEKAEREERARQESLSLERKRLEIAKEKQDREERLRKENAEKQKDYRNETVYDNDNIEEID